jgi:class 3 adenylate cyclase
VAPPGTRYARTADGYVAYQAWGEGSVDLICVGGGWTVETLWDHPRTAATLERLGRFARNIWFDGRGVGASSRRRRTHDATGLDGWIDDVRAVMAATGSERATLMAIGESSASVALFAATYPDRVSALVFVNGLVRFTRGPDYPAGLPPEDLERFQANFEANWASMRQIELLAPSMVDDPGWCRWWHKSQRLAFAPDDAAALWRTVVETDAHHVLPSIQAPTLVLYRRGSRHARPDHAHYLAEHIPGAVIRELEGDDHMFFAGDTDALVDEIEEFVTGVRPTATSNRVLVTVLFTDIVGSSTRAAELGDTRWRTLLDAHDAVVRSQLVRFNGREVNTTGDGFVVTFDGPARAIRCAVELVTALRAIDIDIRAGVHTGEVEVRGDDIGGVAVNTAARVQALAEPGEVLVSRTVTDLVAGSGIAFRDRGEHELRGIPGRWPLFAVDG